MDRSRDDQCFGTSSDTVRLVFPVLKFLWERTSLMLKIGAIMYYGSKAQTRTVEMGIRRWKVEGEKTAVG